MTPGARNRVLIIDDEPSIRQFFADTLALANFEVVLASGADEALTILQDDHAIGLLLVDLNMPGVNGWEFLKQQRQRMDPIPAIIITGATVVPSERIPVCAYLRKPMSKRQLIAAVAAHCTAEPIHTT
jgi:DNA-binding NtrC family response regulator